MYPNLEAELARKNIKRTDLAELLGCTIGTIVAKLRNDREFSFGEVIKIKEYLGVQMPLEVLFSDKPDAPVA